MSSIIQYESTWLNRLNGAVRRFAPKNLMVFFEYISSVIAVRQRMIKLLCLAGMVALSFFGWSFVVYADAAGDEPSIITQQYTVYSDEGDQQTLGLLLQIEQLQRFYRQVFDFRHEPLTDMLVVRYFSSKQSYDTYIESKLGNRYDHFVLIDYNSSSTPNELVLYKTDDAFDRLLAHYSFIQFFEAYIEHPPLWLREGYALFFENSTYHKSSDSVRFKTNSRWLDEIKEIIANDELIPLQDFFTMGYQQVRSQRSIFYPQAWAMVSYFDSYRGHGKDRLVPDLVDVLERQATEEENQQSLLDVVERYFSLDTLEQNLMQYIESLSSFSEVISAAIGSYQNQDNDAAELGFYDGIKVDPTDSTSYYYLGIINYERGNYATAEYFYIESLARGADNSVVYYALGINALAAEEFDKARQYLEQVSTEREELRIQLEAAIDMLP